ncbi:hypothetical protein DVV81_08335 [Clostridium botulinum]|uniref:hypothetical protein n=1 Tax=Clostridium botulinum TaxID=1491 RepID=UPI0019674C8C|nr:hypothetical protein [Clostridium botulinum]MBN1071177.1 hypothetical protein [Clostridium botulinum]
MNKLKEPKYKDIYNVTFVLSKYTHDEILYISKLMLEFFHTIEKKHIEIADLKDINKSIKETLDVGEFFTTAMLELLEEFKREQITAKKAKEIFSTSIAIIIQTKLFDFDTNN